MRLESTYLALLLALVFATGCDEDPPPIPQVDSGVRVDANVMGMDGGPEDGGPDATAGEDGGPDMDGGDRDDAGPSIVDSGLDGGNITMVDARLILPDAQPRDALVIPPRPDAGTCLLPDGGFDYCACASGLDCTTSGICGTNQVCLADRACGGLTCEAQGHPCFDDDDCAAASGCERGGAVAMCIRSGGGCNDSRDCPLGYTCDASVCVERRVTCADATDCPFGYLCNVADSTGAPYCLRIAGRCNSSDACPSGTTCRDVDGDGLMECLGGGSCTSNSACGTGLVCGTASNRMAGCRASGYCQSDSDCASSHQCIDLVGDGGPKECVRRSGSCSSSSDCSPGAICAPETADSAPRCIDAALP